ncbi:MAG: transcriptional repressor LexA [Eubacteriales bacterium]|nr:transcriptional repressor LexA [Eubacteriales bacterium]
MREENFLLKPRQQAVYDFIVRFIAEKAYPPTVREIGAAVGIKSTSNVYGYLKKLEQMGYIRMDASRQRTIAIVRQAQTPPAGDVVNVPVIGAVAAGSPILAFDEVRDYYPVPADCLHGAEKDDVFMLEVEGESMINVGILDGDKILVHRGLAVENGEIGVARVNAVYGDAATVKRIYRENGFMRLQPENDAMEPILVPIEDVRIIGKVIGLYRQY